MDRPASLQKMPQMAKKVFSGMLFDVYQWEQEQFDGTFKTFEKIKRNDTVGIIAVTENKKILITHQEQPGSKVFWGLPGGIMDDGEEALPAGKRELLEETGYASDKWELFSAVQPYSRMDWALFTYIARDCERVAEPHLDSGEKISVHEVTFEELIDLTKSKEFR
ncbi:MAG TPA: NUDIX hydrolase, partial [Candidatus Saccharimonadales bacterium]|nr:NUDIX hydrolase [Candidatus Saccharimonadales bacterium]